MNDTKTDRTNWTSNYGKIIESKFNEIFNDKTLARFLTYAQDAANWNGHPYVGCVNFEDGPASDRGYVCNMKKRGWITTDWDEAIGASSDPCAWITFTEAGIEKAAEYGEDLAWTLTVDW